MCKDPGLPAGAFLLSHETCLLFQVLTCTARYKVKLNFRKAFARLALVKHQRWACPSAECMCPGELYALCIEVAQD